MDMSRSAHAFPRQAIATPGRGALLVALIAAALLAAPPGKALTPPSSAVAAGPRIVAAVGAGIDIVRMPPKPQPSAEPPAAPPKALVMPRADRPELGRFSKLPVMLGSLKGDGQKGWMGVKTDPVELPLALTLGLVNANGAFVVEATPGGPAAQAGVRFGDIIVGLDDKPLLGVSDLRQRVASSAPGSQLVVEVWRSSSGDGDFLGMLRRLAEGGNAYIMYQLGRMYALGIGVGRDERQAVDWYRKGAAAGNSAAMTALAQALLAGRGTDRDAEQGLSWLKSAIDKGSLDASYAMGAITLEGRFVSRDPLEAVRLFTAAAQAGHTPAMVDLGLMYDNANGVAGDHVKAAEWYRKAAELGNSAGMVNLGYLYARGKGVEQSDTLAVSWYRRAVAEGNAAGMHNLAVMADGGRGMTRDPELAASLMLKALDQHYEFSYRQMAQASRNWSRDFRRALQRRLREAGFYSGNVDGEFGETTINAIDAYVNRGQ